MENLTLNEMQMIDGGKLDTPSDYMLAAGSICLCFASPAIGVPCTVAVAIWG